MAEIVHGFQRISRRLLAFLVLKFDRSVWFFLVIGIALRCVALNQPLVDAHLLRQCQTAAVTRNLLEQSGFHLSAQAPWLGDLDKRFVLEPPVYNYLVIAVYHLVGNLDVAGKVTTILLWLSSFLCLQGIWRRLLNRQQTLWANLLFVISPLEMFYGQAFMPEMLVQFLAFGFLLLLIRYQESPRLGRWIWCAAVGLFALLIKLPETAHLYVILLVLLMWREGWKAILRPRYVVAAVLTVAGLKGWAIYRDGVNQDISDAFISTNSLGLFIGSLTDRFHLKPWVMIFLYVGAFAIPGPAALAAVHGLWIFVQREREKIFGAWLLSIAVFYLVWFGNNGAPGQAYYNLPVVAPVCGLFGIGLSALLSRDRVLLWRRTAIATALILTVVPAIPVWQYLLKPDRQILAAAIWTGQWTKPNDVILFRPNHRWDMIDYDINAVFPYYSDRPTFVWTAMTAQKYRKLALERAAYAVVTLPQPPATGLLGAINRWRGAYGRQPERMDWLENYGFQVSARENGFLVYARRGASTGQPNTTILPAR